MKKQILAAVLALAAMTTQPALAGDAAKGDIKIENAWARASAGNARAGAAYLSVENKGDADRIVAAKSGVSDRTELHNHLMENGVMKMRQVDGIDVPAGGKATLQPGGLHVMFMGLKAPLKEGTSFPVTLVFEKAGPVEVVVDVQKVGASGPMHQQGHGTMQHGHGQMKKAN